MKNIFVLTLLLLQLNFYGQETLTFSKVIPLDSTNKANIYVMAKDWFASYYKSANNIIQMDDKDAGLIVGKATTTYSYGSMSYACYDGYIDYTIKIEIKDNKFRVELTNFIHKANVGHSEACTLGSLTTQELYATKGISKKYLNNVWADMKSKMDTYSNDAFKSLEDKAKNLKKKGDW